MIKPSTYAHPMKQTTESFSFNNLSIVLSLIISPESSPAKIIDEDILLRTMFKSNDIPNTEIERALKIPCVNIRNTVSGG